MNAAAQLERRTNGASPDGTRRPQGAGTGGARTQIRAHLGEIPLGEVVELEAMDLPESDVESLLERGVLPGCELCPVRLSPFGDPIVKVEGTVLALRREMACCLRVRRRPAA